jgi:hypothetical protein
LEIQPGPQQLGLGLIGDHPRSRAGRLPGDAGITAVAVFAPGLFTDLTTNRAASPATGLPGTEYEPEQDVLSAEHRPSSAIVIRAESAFWRRFLASPSAP